MEWKISIPLLLPYSTVSRRAAVLGRGTRRKKLDGPIFQGGAIRKHGLLCDTRAIKNMSWREERIEATRSPETTTRAQPRCTRSPTSKVPTYPCDIALYSSNSPPVSSSKHSSVNTQTFQQGDRISAYAQPKPLAIVSHITSHHRAN